MSKWRILAVTAVGESWTISVPVRVPDGFPSELPRSAAEVSTRLSVATIGTTRVGARGATPAEKPQLEGSSFELVRDADGKLLSTSDTAISSSPASVVNLGPVLTLDWDCHRESWLRSWEETGGASVVEERLASGVTAVVFEVEQPFVVPDRGIDAVVERRHGYDKRTGRSVLVESRASGTLNGVPITMEMLQTLQP